MDKMIDYCKKLELYINTDYYKNQIAIGAFSTRFAKFIKENDLSLPQPINPHDEEIEEIKIFPSDEYIEKWFQKKYPAAENWTLIANFFTWGDIVTDYKDLLEDFILENLTESTPLKPLSDEEIEVEIQKVFNRGATIYSNGEYTMNLVMFRKALKKLSTSVDNTVSATEINKLQAFKDYVHKRLDDARIEKYPNGEHSKAGCRIGDRLDILINKNINSNWERLKLQKQIDSLTSQLSLYKESMEQHSINYSIYWDKHKFEYNQSDRSLIYKDFLKTTTTNKNE